MIVATLWWYIARCAEWIIPAMMSCALISGVFRWTGFEELYIRSLRFMFEQTERATSQRDQDERLSSLTTLSEKNQDGALEAIFQKYMSQSTENGKVNGQTKRRTTNVFGQSLDLVHLGLATIVEDEFLPRFKHQRLKTWNMMTRTKEKHPTPWWTQLVWCLGLFVRYGILLPGRLLNFCGLYTGSIVFVLLAVALLPRRGTSRITFYRYIMAVFFGEFSGCIFSPKFHSVQHRPTKGMAVVNHTSPFDLFILLADVPYCLTGQKHGGYMGMLQGLYSQLAPHIWFERSSASDRSAMRKMLIDHTQKPENPPILIFPEGTCTNNTATMMFKKGSFECFNAVNPIAIKYDPMFCDFFWNSTEQSSMRYLLHVLTSWQVVCDVWYLPPMTRHKGESSADFTGRVKRAISQAAQLDELPWDGNLKRSAVKDEFKERAQFMFSQRFLRP